MANPSCSHLSPCSSCPHTVLIVFEFSTDCKTLKLEKTFVSASPPIYAPVKLSEGGRDVARGKIWDVHAATAVVVCWATCPDKKRRENELKLLRTDLTMSSWTPARKNRKGAEDKRDMDDSHYFYKDSIFGIRPVGGMQGQDGEDPGSTAFELFV